MAGDTAVQTLVPVTAAVISGLEQALDQARKQQASQAAETIRQMQASLTALKAALLTRRDAVEQERKTTVADLLKVNAEVGTCRDALGFCRTSIRELEGKITAAEATRNYLEADITKLENELKAIEEKYNDKKDSYDAAYDYSYNEFDGGSPFDVFGSFVRGSTVMVATHAIESFDLEYKRLKEDVEERRSHRQSLSIQMSVSQFALTQLTRIQKENEGKLATLEARENVLHAKQGELKVKVALLNNLLYFCASLQGLVNRSESDSIVLLTHVASLDGKIAIESDDLSVQYSGTLRQSLTKFAEEYDRGLA